MHAFRCHFRRSLAVSVQIAKIYYIWSILGAKPDKFQNEQMCMLQDKRVFFVDRGQLPKLEKALHQAVHVFQNVPVALHENNVNRNANLPFTNNVFVAVSYISLLPHLRE